MMQVLLYGSGSVKRAEAEQRVIFELQPHLAAAGNLGKPPAVAETLISLLSRAQAGTQVPDIPASNPSNAYLLAAVALESARAESGPLTDDESAPTPLMHALAYEAAAQPKSIEHTVFSSLSQASFRQTADRLLCRAPTQSPALNGALQREKAARSTNGRSHSQQQPAPLETRAFSKLEHLATTLISSVAFKGDKITAVDAPRTTTRAEPLLEHLVHACPSLLISERCMQCWLEQENSREVQVAVQEWVGRGSKLAPTHVQHVLHRFLISRAAEAHPEAASCTALAQSAGLLDIVEMSRQHSLVGDVSTGVHGMRCNLLRCSFECACRCIWCLS